MGKINIGIKTKAEMLTMIAELREGKSRRDISKRRDKQMIDKFRALE